VKILIVEDEFGSRKLLQSFLEPYGDCDIAVDGEEAMDAFTTALNENHPYDLICLDIMMPKMSGQEVLRNIRRIEKERGILGRKGVKVIMTTALGDPVNITEAFKSQREAYITKPISKQKLLDEIKNLGFLEKRVQKGAGLLNNEPLIDRERALKHVEGDEEFLKEILDIFKEEIPERIESFNKALKENNIEKIASLAHSLESVSGTVGAYSCSEYAMEVEKAAKEDDKEKVRRLYPKIEELLNAIKLHLEKGL